MNNAKICCIALGGGGKKALNLLKKEVQGDLKFLEVDKKFFKNSEEEKDKIKNEIGKSDIVFIILGLGGKTGMGLVSEVAEIGKSSGALTIGVATMPFSFEGRKIREIANQGLEKLKNSFDAYILVENDNLTKLSDSAMTMTEAFKVSDCLLSRAIRGLSDLILIEGMINIEVKDIKDALKGFSEIGIGSAFGEDRAIKAAKDAIKSPLLQKPMKDAQKLIINVTGGRDLSLNEVVDAVKILTEEVSENAAIHFGAVVDEKEKQSIYITIIASDFRKEP
ncbi:cell division FtsZ family protein [bacterium]|nr:cell division FtsZ family protein [bacterium]